jgi:hypothetical protein
VALAAALFPYAIRKAAATRRCHGHCAQFKSSQLRTRRRSWDLVYVYVGTENAISFWAPTHAQRAAAWTNNTWTLAPMFFFAGLLGGRGAAAAVLLRLKEVTVAVGGVLLAAAGQILFLTADSPRLYSLARSSQVSV